MTLQKHPSTEQRGINKVDARAAVATALEKHA